MVDGRGEAEGGCARDSSDGEEGGEVPMSSRLKITAVVACPMAVVSG